MTAAVITATVLLVAPPTLLRLGLETTLHEAHPELSLICVTDLATFYARIQKSPPALVILDSKLLGTTAIPWLSFLNSLPISQPLLVLAGRRCSPLLTRLLSTRAHSRVLLERAGPADFLTAVERLLPASGRVPIDTQMCGVYARRYRLAEPVTLFSPRELEVLRLIAADQTNSEIAHRLAISIRTVEAHRRVMLEKIGTRSTVGMVLQAVRQGWLQVS